MDLKLILAVAVPVVYAAKRTYQKITQAATGKPAKPWYLETETYVLILTELALLAEEIGKLFGNE